MYLYGLTNIKETRPGQHTISHRNKWLHVQCVNNRLLVYITVYGLFTGEKERRPILLANRKEIWFAAPFLRSKD
jgi:hypothetical protein